MALEFILLENGSGHILLEDSSGSILLEAQPGLATLTFTPSGSLVATGSLLGNGLLTFTPTGRLTTTTDALYGMTSGTSAEIIYDSNSGDGPFLYYLTSGSAPNKPYEEN